MVLDPYSLLRLGKGTLYLLIWFVVFWGVSVGAGMAVQADTITETQIELNGTVLSDPGSNETVDLLNINSSRADRRVVYELRMKEVPEQCEVSDKRDVLERWRVYNDMYCSPPEPLSDRDREVYRATVLSMSQFFLPVLVGASNLFGGFIYLVAPGISETGATYLGYVSVFGPPGGYGLLWVRRRYQSY